MNFSQLIEIMSSNGISTLADIARELGISPQSVSNWKARDRVPYKYALEIQARYNMEKSMDRNYSSQTTDRMKREDDKQSIPLPPMFVEKEKTYHLSTILSPLARNIRVIVITPLVFFFSALLLFVIFLAIPEKEVDDIDKVYIAKAKMVVSGSGGFASSEGAPASGIVQMLGLKTSGAGSGASSLASPAIWPELLNSHAFAKRMLNTKYHTDKYEEEKSLLEMAILISREREQRPTLMDRLLHRKTGEIDDEMPHVGLDTLVMQYILILPSMVEFGFEGSFQTLTVSAFESQLAVDIAYTVLHELEQFSHYFQDKSLKEKREYIENRIEIVGKELKEAEEKLRIFTETNRTISSLTLQWQLNRLNREVSHYQGMYTNLKNNLENVKIDLVQDQNSVIQIVDYPIPPLGPETVSSPVRSPKMIFLSTLIGFGLGVVIALARGYYSIIEDDEKKRLSDIKIEAKTSFKSLSTAIKRITPFSRSKKISMK